MKIFHIWKKSVTARKLLFYPKKLFQGLKSQDKTYQLYIKDLIIFIFSLIVILLLLKSTRPPDIYNPFPDNDLLELQGELTGDSVKINAGKYIYPVLITEAVSKKRITVFMEKKIKIISRGENLEWGDHVKIESFDINVSSFYTGDVKLTEKGKNLFFRIRKNIKDVIEQKIGYTGSDNGLTLALLTGNRINLLRDDIVKFRKSGCSHLLALSGMHLGIISLFFYFLIKPLAGVKAALLSLNIVNIFYLLVSGLSPSLIRACILSAVLTYAKLAGKKPPLYRSLYLTFLINILVTPDLVTELSFQYSYLALAGIVLFAKPFYRIMLPLLPPLFAAPLSCSISAQIFTAPLSALVFGEIFPSGIAASVAVTPVIVLFMWSCMVSLFIPQITLFNPLSALFSAFNNILSVIIIKTVSFFSIFPPLSFNRLTFTLLIIFNLSVIIIFTVPNPGLKIFKRYR